MCGDGGWGIAFGGRRSLIWVWEHWSRRALGGGIGRFADIVREPAIRLVRNVELRGRWGETGIGVGVRGDVETEVVAGRDGVFV